MATPKTPISPKVTAAGAAAAVATILVWVADVTIALEVPAGVEGAFVVLLTLIGGYVMPDPLRIPDGTGKRRKSDA